MEHHFEMLRILKEAWPSYKKDEPFAVHSGTRKGFMIVFEIETLQVFFAIFCGVRGGKTATVYVIDTSQKVEVDQLLCCDSESTEGALVNSLIGIGDRFDEYCPQLLIEEMERWRKNPESIRTFATCIGFGQSSVITVSGGAPSLGKRH